MSIILLLLFITTTVSAADIQPGSALFAADSNSKWTSPNNTSFTFTFIPDPSGAAFFAAIIYDNNPSIPIWTAGAAATDSNASLRLLPNGNLELRNGSSNSLVWESSTSGRGVSAAALDNSGNFVLKNANSSNIWSTFGNPTDTIVPSQNFTKNQTLVNGLYTFGLMDNGYLTLKWNNTITYFSSGLNASANWSLPSLSILPIGIITLSDPLLRSPLNLVYSSDYAETGSGEILRFVKIDDDGNLRIYSALKGSGSSRASVKWSAVADQCQVFGYCGNMGICSYNNTGPVCGCPSRNFEPVDARDSRKGCRPKVDVQNCEGNNRTMLQLNLTVLLTYPPESNGGNTQVFSTGFQACRTNCLLSHPCLGSTSLADGTGFCYQKTTNFISGYQSPAVPSTTFFKICGQPDPNPPANSGAD